MAMTISPRTASSICTSRGPQKFNVFKYIKCWLMHKNDKFNTETTTMMGIKGGRHVFNFPCHKEADARNMY
jgi:hypothetical protein